MKIAAFPQLSTKELEFSPIISKLPYQWREKWINKASEYKERYSAPYTSFTHFVKLIQDLCRVTNNHEFQFSEQQKKRLKPKTLDRFVQ